MSATGAPRHVSLIKSLEGGWLKLPMKVMADVGPATQTLGGLLRVTNKETFVEAKTIAENARLPLSTVRKHLVTLNDRGWIKNAGRERTRTGRPRRTCTIKLTKQTHDQMDPYGFLPWWACCSITNVGRMPWPSKAVLSVVLARLCSLKKAANEACPVGTVGNDLIGAIENLNGDERFRFSLDRLAEQTGLSRESIVSAKRWLAKYRLINWTGDNGSRGADRLTPNHEFRVVVTPLESDRCCLSFATD